MNNDEWGKREAKIQAVEDLRFPSAPENGTVDWQRFCVMKRERAYRRKAQGLSRAHAKYFIKGAEHAKT